MGQNGNGLKTDKNGNRTEIKRERNGITRPVVRTGDGNFFLTPTVYCFKNDAVEEITSRSRYLSLHSPQHADASGLLDCIGDTLSLFGVDSVLDQDSVLRVE